MRLRHIEIFHAIYTTGSITNAAKMLHVSQPSVSKVLSHAEIQLGFKLFKRVKGRLIPSDEANMLFDDVDKIYQQLRSIKNTASNIKRSEFGNINIGITPALGFDALPSAIATYHSKFEKVNFDIQTIHNNDVLQALLERKCELAVLFSPTHIDGISNKEIARSELVLVYPKKLFKSEPESISFDDIKDTEFIDIADSGPLGDLLWQRLLEENVELPSRIKAQTYFVAARMVSKGLGVCVVDKYTAMGNLDDNIAFASFAPKITFGVHALSLENRSLSKVTEDFLEQLTKELSDTYIDT